MKTSFAGILGLALLVMAPGAQAAQLDGLWKTKSGDQAQFYACGKAHCVKLVSGKYQGQVIADDLMDDGTGVFSGHLRDPADDKVYSGQASLSDPQTLQLKGCALKIFCKSQYWTRLP